MRQSGMQKPPHYEDVHNCQEENLDAPNGGADKLLATIGFAAEWLARKWKASMPEIKLLDDDDDDDDNLLPALPSVVRSGSFITKLLSTSDSEK